MPPTSWLRSPPMLQYSHGWRKDYLEPKDLYRQCRTITQQNGVAASLIFLINYCNIFDSMISIKVCLMHPLETTLQTHITWIKWRVHYTFYKIFIYRTKTVINIRLYVSVIDCSAVPLHWKSFGCLLPLPVKSSGDRFWISILGKVAWLSSDRVE